MVHTIHPTTSVSYRCGHSYHTSCGTYCASVSSSWYSPCTQCIGSLGAGAAGTGVGFDLDKVADGDSPASTNPAESSFSTSDSTARWTFHLRVGSGLSSSVWSNTGTGFGHRARRFERRWWCCRSSAGSGWAPAFLLLHLRTHLRRLRRLLRLLWGSHILHDHGASEAVIMGRTIEEPDGHPQELYKGSCSLVRHFGWRGQAGDCQ
ncbi:hypothetical protein FB451DRAFT_1235804 [Mycena latifolia]|nr:hypothetical protein FB451DRAFT_1235804 [Mycena latifolia]